jgi:hypothetical protein
VKAQLTKVTAERDAARSIALELKARIDAATAHINDAQRALEGGQ